jgi:predicted dehydrogenase
MERRQFIRKVVQTAAGTSVAALAGGRVLGANDRINLALIGCGGRGRYDLGLALQNPGVNLAAVCDVYEPQAEKAKALGGSNCRAYSDFRKLLEQKDIDAVLIATPDHWHATIEVLACQAGKDVYTEKPLAYTIREGRAMVNAARRYNRVVQTGTQHRSAPHLREVERLIQSGAIGPVHFVRVWNYLNLSPDGIGAAADSNPPAGLDWDFYLGPAPKVPFNENRFLVTYRWFWDYAGGMATDYGTHRFDTIHQVMHVDAPTTVSGSGSRYELKDGGDVPDTLQITYEYPGFIMSYEASMLNGHGVGGRTPGKQYYNMRGKDDRPNGMAFYGTKGALFADRIGFEVYPELVAESGPGAPMPAANSKEEFRTKHIDSPGADVTGMHVKNFLDCVRSRQKPVADVEIGHRSTTVPLLGNIAIRTGHKLHWDAENEEIVGDPQASALLSRNARQPWEDILEDSGK